MTTTTTTLTTTPATGRMVPAGWALEGLKVQTRATTGMVEVFAYLTIDGQRVGTIEDHGDGGSCAFRPNTREGRLAYEAGVAAVTATDPEAYDETVNNRLVLEAEVTERLARLAKQHKTGMVRGLVQVQPEGEWDEPTFYTVQANLVAGSFRARLVADGMTHVWDGTRWEALAT